MPCKKRTSKEKSCSLCKNRYLPNYAKQKFCSSECSQINLNRFNSGRKHSEEHCKKISIALKGKLLSKEHRKKISLAARKRWISENQRKKLSLSMRGKTLSEETKSKISASLKKRALNEEFRKRLGNAQRGKPRSEETRKKIGLGNKGKLVSEETKRKLSLSASIRQQSRKTPFWGKSGFVNGTKLRSRWEIAFALYLNDRDVPWEYEKKHYLLSSNRYYTPDFFVGNQIFEIKGIWIGDAEHKFNLFKKEYPQISIKVLEHEQLKMILEQYKEKVQQLIS